MSFLVVPAARAAYVMTFRQVGPDVVGTGSGSIDMTDLTVFSATNLGNDRLDPHMGQATLGAPTAPNSAGTYYQVVSGPAAFGTGFVSIANSGTGPLVGISENFNSLFIPFGYVSGADFGTSTATWSNKTFSSLGLTPGTYLYTWGAAAHADSLTLQVTVPEPASLSLLALTSVTLRRRRDAR